MNAKTLAATRAALKVAIAITGFIIRNAGTITSAATAIHAWALKAAEKAADTKAVAAYAKFEQANAAVAALRKEADRQYKAWCDKCDDAYTVAIAVREELATLG